LRRGLARLPGVARLGRRSFNALRLARHGMLLPRLKQEIAGRKELSWIANVFRRPEPPPPEPVVVAPSAGVHDPVREVASYRAMRQRIAAQRADRLGAVRVEPLALMQVAGSDLAAVAAGLRFAKSDAPVVSIVVPAYNNVALTLECLMALNRFTAADIPFEVIVADDCSTDRTAELIAAIEGVVHIRNERNLHFLRTCNAAARHARGEFLVFLNNDVQVTKGWLPPLLDVFRDERAAGAAGPRILYPGGHLQEAGVLVNPDATARMIGLDGDPNEPRYRFKRRVDYCSGACLMVPAARFRELGGFDEALAPAYCEDMDLCLRLRGLGLDVWYVPQSTVAHHLSRTTAQGGNDAKMRMIVANQQKVMESRQREIESLNDVRLFAFYLPQFHPIPENDRWWGAGFTEWTNVTRAVPQYDGHDQPKLPADLGFYDLRIASVMEQQAELARRYGISGFCFYYYWFAGHRLLETPIERMLSSGSPDFPFFLCWANENWTRRWDGQESEMLIAQEHSPEDDLAVIRDLMRYMRDPRYVRIGGKPLLLVYRVGLFPDFAATAARWRAACRAEGLGEIYLAAVESFSHSVDGGDMRVFGVDAAVQFPPHGHPPPWRPEGRRVRDDFQGRLYDYEGAALQFLDARFPAMPRFPGVIPAWDNTARRMSNAAIFDGAGPGAFQAWLEEAILQTREHNAPDERIVFINAWNEWAEGACLEPDRVHGHAWLEAVRNARDAQRLRRD
jgi:GT2 family glycosyltransferase